MLTSQVKRQFTAEEITKLVMELGSGAPRHGYNGELIFQTICHNPPHEGSYKLYYYADNGTFHCYTHCGDTFDVYELVMRSRKCLFRQALEYIQQTLGIVSERKVGFAPEPVISEDWVLLDKYSGRKRSSTTENVYALISQNVLEVYANICPIEWQQDGISCEAMQKYGIRFDVSKNEAIIPHFDIEGGLIGIRSRTFDPLRVANGNKYMPTQLEGADYRHSLRYNLYGLNNTKEAIRRLGKVMIYESEKAVLQCETFYGDNNFSVGVCGSNVSIAQRNIILGLGVREVFLGFDKEYHEAYTPESDEYAEKILRIAGLFAPFVTVYVLWDVNGLIGYKDSPTDKGRSVLERLMKEKFEVGTDDTISSSASSKKESRKQHEQ